MPNGMKLVIWSSEWISDSRAEHRVQVCLGPQCQRLKKEVVEGTPHAVRHQAPVPPLRKAEML